MSDFPNAWRNTAIKNVIFDFGGVLLNLDPMKTFRGFQDMFGIKFEKGETVTDKFLDILKDFERGQVNEETFIWRIQKLAPGTPEAKLIIDTWNAMLLDLPAQNITLLQRLKAFGFGVYLLSNTNSMHIKIVLDGIATAHQEPNFEGYFDGIIYSHKVNARKPEAAIYDRIIKDYGLIPKESVFIDDMEQNVLGARACGLHSVLHPQNQDITTSIDTYLAQFPKS